MIKRFYELLFIQVYFPFLQNSFWIFPPAIFFFFLLNFRSSQNDNLHQKKNHKGAWWRDSSHSRIRNSYAAVSQNDAQVVAIIGWPCTLFYGPGLLDVRTSCRKIARRDVDQGRISLNAIVLFLFFLPTLWCISNSRAFVPCTYVYAMMLPAMWIIDGPWTVSSNKSTMTFAGITWWRWKSSRT